MNLFTCENFNCFAPTFLLLFQRRICATFRGVALFSHPRGGQSTYTSGTTYSKKLSLR